MPWQRSGFDRVVGWGRKSAGQKALALSATSGKPFVLVEDGFLRSIRPGHHDVQMSFVFDRTGIYYDATGPSDLEMLITARAAQPFPKAGFARARDGLTLLRRTRLSKYNDGALAAPEDLFSGKSARVLVIDQTRHDASIAYGLADETSFAAMLEAALAENPDAEILVKTHPEVSAGTKRGLLSGASGGRLTLVRAALNPWVLLEQVDKVYVVSSQLGFEALMAGCAVVCFGAPFYAGWGLTDDRVAVSRRSARPTLEQVFAAVYFDYMRYVSAHTGAAISFEQAVDELAQLRDRHHGRVG